MKQALKNIFRKEIVPQKTVTIEEAISATEYIVIDSANRIQRVQSDTKKVKGDVVVIQNGWIIGKGKLNKSISTFSI